MNPLMITAYASIAAFALGGWLGYQLESGRSAKREVAVQVAHIAELQRVATETRAAQTAVDTLSSMLESERAKRIPRVQTITTEVVRYEQLPASRRCDLDPAWRVLHDAAATSMPPATDSTGLVVAGVAPVTDATALGTVTRNYETCNEALGKVRGWQDWYVITAPKTAP